VIAIIVRPAFLDRAIALPVMFRLWQPEHKHFAAGKADPERPAKAVLAREMTELLAARLPGHTVHEVGDGAYATEA